MLFYCKKINIIHILVQLITISLNLFKLTLALHKDNCIKRLHNDITDISLLNNYIAKLYVKLKK